MGNDRDYSQDCANKFLEIRQHIRSFGTRVFEKDSTALYSWNWDDLKSNVYIVNNDAIEIISGLNFEIIFSHNNNTLEYSTGTQLHLESVYAKVSCIKTIKKLLKLQNKTENN